MLWVSGVGGGMPFLRLLIDGKPSCASIGLGTCSAVTLGLFVPTVETAPEEL